MTEFEIRSAAGILIFTTPDKDLAMKEARAKAVTFPGLEVFEIIHQAPIRRRVWRERPALRLVGAA